jgi:SAM-dependent methyltransferase
VSREGSRPCAVCGGDDLELLHRQEFLLPGDRRTHYEVVCCAACGFAFATEIPSPDEYEAYYRANLKYTYPGSGHVCGSLEAVHGACFELVDRAIERRSPPLRGRATRVVDVGCSTGHLLSRFRRAGYADLEGVDPAPECRDLAGRLYGVDVVTATLSEYRPVAPAGVVLLSSVLEHLPDPEVALANVNGVLRKDGLLFIQVPDADRFGVGMKEPFLEFSIEHVNYFNEASLGRLLGNAGFAPDEVSREVLDVNATSYPALNAVFRKTDEPPDIPGPSDTSALRVYVALSRERLAAVECAMASLASEGGEVVVWGVGSLAARLLATTSLTGVNIVGFVDSNRGLHGKTLNGRVIQSPATLRGRRTTVLVASYVWAEEICRTLRTDLGYEGRVLTLP